MPTNVTGTRRGFTLVELMVSLVVCGFVLLGARMMFDGLAGAAHRTMLAAREADRVANADHLTRMLFARLEIGLVGDTTFGGDPRSVHFSTWCQTPFGWLERCHALIALEVYRDTNLLVAHLAPSEPRGNVGVGRLILARGFRSGALRYLNDPRAGGRWFVTWGDGIVAPLAVGVMLDGDTAIMRIGERG